MSCRKMRDYSSQSTATNLLESATASFALALARHSFINAAAASTACSATSQAAPRRENRPNKPFVHLASRHRASRPLHKNAWRAQQRGVNAPGLVGSCCIRPAWLHAPNTRSYCTVPPLPWAKRCRRLRQRVSQRRTERLRAEARSDLTAWLQ